MKNNIIEEFKNETNALILNELGISFEEFRNLSVDELKLICLRLKLTKLERHYKISQNSDDINKILNAYKEETNEVIMKAYGITFDEFRTLSIDELIIMVRNKKHTIQKRK